MFPENPPIEFAEGRFIGIEGRAAIEFIGGRYAGIEGRDIGMEGRAIPPPPPR